MLDVFFNAMAGRGQGSAWKASRCKIVVGFGGRRKGVPQDEVTKFPWGTSDSNPKILTYPSLGNWPSSQPGKFGKPSTQNCLTCYPGYVFFFPRRVHTPSNSLPPQKNDGPHIVSCCWGVTFFHPNISREIREIPPKGPKVWGFQEVVLFPFSWNRLPFGFKSWFKSQGRRPKRLWAWSMKVRLVTQVLFHSLWWKAWRICFSGSLKPL